MGVDRDVSTAYCWSSSGDDVDWLCLIISSTRERLGKINDNQPVNKHLERNFFFQIWTLIRYDALVISISSRDIVA